MSGEDKDLRKVHSAKPTPTQPFSAPVRNPLSEQMPNPHADQSVQRGPGPLPHCCR